MYVGIMWQWKKKKNLTIMLKNLIDIMLHDQEPDVMETSSAMGKTILWRLKSEQWPPCRGEDWKGHWDISGAVIVLYKFICDYIGI